MGYTCPDCASDKITWDGLEMYDCLSCGAAFVPALVNWSDDRD